MVRKQTGPRPHAHFRHHSQISLPAVEDVQQRLMDVLSPSLLDRRQLERRDSWPPERRIRLRQRLLALPLTTATIVSLVWRRVPSIAEVQKVSARDRLLTMAPLQINPQAIPTWLDALPAAVIGRLFAAVCGWLHSQASAAIKRSDRAVGCEPSSGPTSEKDAAYRYLASRESHRSG